MLKFGVGIVFAIDTLPFYQSRENLSMR